MQICALFLAKPNVYIIVLHSFLFACNIGHLLEVAISTAVCIIKKFLFPKHRHNKIHVWKKRGTVQNVRSSVI